VHSTALITLKLENIKINILSVFFQITETRNSSSSHSNRLILLNCIVIMVIIGGNYRVNTDIYCSGRLRVSGTVHNSERQLKPSLGKLHKL